MTPTELRTRMEALDLTVNQFAAAIHVTPWAVRKWLAPEGPSHRKIPGPVIAWLDLVSHIRNPETLKSYRVGNAMMSDLFDRVIRGADQARHP